jgi:hypothetical protein
MLRVTAVELACHAHCVMLTATSQVWRTALFFAAQLANSPRAHGGQIERLRRRPTPHGHIDGHDGRAHERTANGSPLELPPYPARQAEYACN